MTTDVPLRLRVLMGLTTVLKSITPANGYASNLSDFADAVDETVTRSRVFRGRNVFGPDDPETLVAILENPHTEPTQHDSPRGSSVVIGPWELLVQGFVPDDPVNPSDPAHILMADVKKALVAERLKLSGGNLEPDVFGTGRAVSDLMIGSGVVRPVDDVSAKTCFWLLLTVELAEDISNPFA